MTAIEEMAGTASEDAAAATTDAAVLLLGDAPAPDATECDWGSAPIVASRSAAVVARCLRHRPLW